MNVTERINRVLFILSYVSQNQGIHIEDLARRVDLTPRQLQKELDFILLIGKPPFQPDDYIDIYTLDDRVYIEFDQMLNRPLRLTHPEAISLVMSLQLLDPEVDPKRVASLTQKIRKAISDSMSQTGYVKDRIVFQDTPRPVSQHFALLKEAVKTVCKVEIEYYSISQNQTSRRTIHPYFFTKSVGYWYLTGYCELREDVRTFKFERILEVKLKEETFDPPPGGELEKYRQSFLRLMGKFEIQIYFDSQVAPWIREQWAHSVEDQRDGGVILTFSSETLEYPSRLVLAHANHCRVIRPRELAEKVHIEAAEISSLYEVRNQKSEARSSKSEIETPTSGC